MPITDPLLRHPVFDKRDNVTSSKYGPHGSPLNPATPPPYDRDDFFNIRAHKRLNATWLKHMMYSDTQINQIRKEEDQVEAFVGFVNGLGGYVSSCALGNVRGDRVKSVSDEGG